jgi:hypothetical protein
MFCTFPWEEEQEQELEQEQEQEQEQEAAVDDNNFYGRG